MRISKVLSWSRKFCLQGFSKKCPKSVMISFHKVACNSLQPLINRILLFSLIRVIIMPWARSLLFLFDVTILEKSFDHVPFLAFFRRFHEVGGESFVLVRLFLD